MKSSVFSILLIIFTIFFVISCSSSGANGIAEKPKQQPNIEKSKEPESIPGVLLSFDDYNPVTWEKHFYLFEKYGAKVTFFVTGKSVTKFMLNAQRRGHEIGYHTINHPNLTKVSKNVFYTQTISRKNAFKRSGIDLTSFAYPYGSYSPWMNKELLKYYKIVRGFNGFNIYSKDELKSGFINSASIDNYFFETDRSFKQNIEKMVRLAKRSGMIICFTTHGISDNVWGITPKRLEFVLEECKKNGLIFYRYKDFQ